MKYSVPKVFQCFIVVCCVIVCNGSTVVTGTATDPFQEAADYLHALDEEMFGTSIDGEQIQLMIDLFLERTGCSSQTDAETCYKVNNYSHNPHPHHYAHILYTFYHTSVSFPCNPS